MVVKGTRWVKSSLITDNKWAICHFLMHERSKTPVPGIWVQVTFEQNFFEDEESI